MSHETAYIPALGLSGLTPAYDAIMAAFFPEGRLRRPLVDALGTRPGDVVIDVGCGTATVSLLIQESAPGALVAALDIDPTILAAALRKAIDRAAPVQFGQGSAAALPFADACADHVVSSLMLHHLSHALKEQMLAECARVLRPGGRLHILDFGPPSIDWLRGLLVPLMAGFEHVDDNLHGRVPAMLTTAGFVDVRTRPIAFAGAVQLYEGTR